MAHGLVHFGNTARLLIGGRSDVANDANHLFNATDDLLHGRARILRIAHPTIHGGNTGANQLFNLIGGICAAVRQRAHLPCHHRKAPSLLAGAGRLNRCIQGQDVGLKRNGINQANDVGNAAAGIGNLLHADHRPLHHRPALPRCLRSHCGQLVGLACRIRRLVYRAGQLFQ